MIGTGVNIITDILTIILYQRLCLPLELEDDHIQIIHKHSSLFAVLLVATCSLYSEKCWVKKREFNRNIPSFSIL